MVYEVDCRMMLSFKENESYFVVSSHILYYSIVIYKFNHKNYYIYISADSPACKNR